LDFFVFRHQGCKALAIVFATLEPQGSIIPATLLFYFVFLTILCLFVILKIAELLIKSKRPKETNNKPLMTPIYVGMTPILTIVIFSRI